MNNFRAHNTWPSGMSYNHWKIMVCVLSLPANTTDHLEPLNLRTEAAKDFLRDMFRKWYAKEISQSLQNEPENQVVPVDM